MTKKIKTLWETFTQKYNEIDPPLRAYFSKMYLIFICSTVISFCIFASFKMWNILLLAILFLLLLLGVNFYHTLKCLQGNVLLLKGKCTEIFIPKKVSLRPSSFNIQSQFFKRDYAMILTEDNKYVKIYNIKRLNLKPDNFICVYFPKEQLFQINDDTFSIENYYHVYIERYMTTQN